LGGGGGCAFSADRGNLFVKTTVTRSRRARRRRTTCTRVGTTSCSRSAAAPARTSSTRPTSTSRQSSGGQGGRGGGYFDFLAKHVSRHEPRETSSAWATPCHYRERARNIVVQNIDDTLSVDFGFLRGLDAAYSTCGHERVLPDRAAAAQFAQPNPTRRWQRRTSTADRLQDRFLATGTGACTTRTGRDRRSGGFPRRGEERTDAVLFGDVDGDGRTGRC